MSTDARLSELLSCWEGRRACAVKLIRMDHAGDSSSLQRFEREVQAMATLNHWNTAEIYDYGRAADGTFYYAMEYLPGLDMETLIELHGPLPAGQSSTCCGRCVLPYTRPTQSAWSTGTSNPAT